MHDIHSSTNPHQAPSTGPMLGAGDTTVNKTKQIRSMSLWSLYSWFKFNQYEKYSREILFTI